MRIAMVGAGGVGGYFGGRLAQSGESVTFIARGAHLAALREKGLRLESIEGNAHLPKVSATDRPEEVGAVDVVFVCVKTWQVPEVAQRLSPLVGPDTLVVPLENGVEAPDQLAAVLGAKPVAGGVCHIMAFVLAPGVVRHAGVRPTVQVGELAGGTSARVDRVVQALARSGVSARASDDIRAAMWKKLVFISSVSGVGAVTRATAGVNRVVPETRRLLEQAMHEVVAVARAAGTPLGDEVVRETMAFVDSLPADSTASMQRDIVDGKPSELDAQSGAVARLGATLGVPTPAHSFIAAALAPQELRARGRAKF
jgi:2-dehydropantoate 2-reductase